MAAEASYSWPAVQYIDSAVEIIVMCHGCRVIVSVRADDLRPEDGNPDNGLHREFLQLLGPHRLKERDDSEQDAMMRFVLPTCETFLRQLSGASQRFPMTTLLDRLHPPTFTLRMYNKKGELAFDFYQRDPRYRIDSIRSFDRIQMRTEVPRSENLQHFRNTELSIDSTVSDAFSGSTLHPVAVHMTSDKTGHTMMFKPAWNPRSFFRELNVFVKLQLHPEQVELPIPSILGLVTHGEHDNVEGFLMTRIEPGTILSERIPGSSISLRRRWMHQIEHAVHAIHEVGAIWGDAKPDNVLIDAGGNAWVTDFGGSYTEGWANPDIEDRVLRDLDALEKIRAFLNLEYSPVDATSHTSSAAEDSTTVDP